MIHGKEGKLPRLVGRVNKAIRGLKVVVNGAKSDFAR